MIKVRGLVHVPQAVLDHADKIKYDNYKVNTPTNSRFKIHKLAKAGGDEMMDSLAGVIGLPRKKLDFVYFSVCKGAEPHTDKLNPEKYEDVTFVIPVILPKGCSVITAEEHEREVGVGVVYEFDHTKIHSMVLEDTESGCVVVMVAVKK
jgi:hypothetical protein